MTTSYQHKASHDNILPTNTIIAILIICIKNAIRLPSRVFSVPAHKRGYIPHVCMYGTWPHVCMVPGHTYVWYLATCMYGTWPHVCMVPGHTYMYGIWPHVRMVPGHTYVWYLATIICMVPGHTYVWYLATRMYGTWPLVFAHQFAGHSCNGIPDTQRHHTSIQ